MKVHCVGDETRQIGVAIQAKKLEIVELWVIFELETQLRKEKWGWVVLLPTVSVAEIKSHLKKCRNFFPVIGL